MGAHKRKNFVPYYQYNQDMKKMKTAPTTAAGPPRVQTSQDVKITAKTISFVGPKLDCTVDKMVKEYVTQFQAEGYQVIFTLQKGIQDILRYVPKWVVLFRVGTNPEFPMELGLENTVRVIKHLQQLGVRVVYYIDDFIVTANHNAPVTIASNCDALIVATTELKEFFSKVTTFTVPIIHVPTHVDLPVFDFLPPIAYFEAMKRYKIFMSSGGRIGTIGFHDICEKANEIPEFDDVQWIINMAGVAQLRTVVNRFRNLHKIYLDWLALESYYALCKSVDLIINPASPEDLNYICPPQWQQTWLNSKSAVKYTMAGAARIPIVAANSMRSYVEAIKDGETGFIVKSADEFIEKILYLKNNPDKAKEMGAAARTDIEEKFDIRKRYASYRDAITGAYKEEDTAKGILIGISDGGPGSFSNIMRKQVPLLTGKKYKVTDQDSPSIKAALSVAFLNHEAIQGAKKRDPSLRMVQRMDGLPFVSFLGDDTGLAPGEIQNVIMEVMKKNYEMADYIVWQSEFAKKVWAPYVDTTKPSSIIYNGVDFETFNSTAPFMPLPGEKTKILVNSWSLFPHKRADLAVKIANEYPEIEFHFIGNFFYKDTVKTMEELSKYPNITYYGPIKNLAQIRNFYRAVDALLFTSEMEGSPNTALEAAACGCPIIYNKACSVVPEMFGEDLVFGFDDDESGMDELYFIFEKLNDGNLILPMRQKMLAKIQEFSAEKMVKKYLEILI
jgi:glycosyltransferase involved in cell wall biosynthesis